ncbi:hypothetical protein [Acidithiobacillus ferrooxidans]|uniref:hypothetical protein n=1 Tax=Acidithiobacillus ferrooxidans TaxID=920 RepID=UPI0039AF0738
MEEHKEEAVAMICEKRYRIWAIYVWRRYQHVDRSYREAEVAEAISNGQPGEGHWQQRYGWPKILPQTNPQSPGRRWLAPSIG